MLTFINRRTLGRTFMRGAALCLLALAATLLRPSEARAQWTTSGTSTTTTNNVGIGTTSPEQPLHVHGSVEILSTGAGAGFKFRDRGSASATNDWVWYSQGNVARFWRAGTGDLFGITTDGKLGIGTNAPGRRLEVLAPDGEAARLYRNAANAGWGVNMVFALNNSNNVRTDYAGVHGILGSAAAGAEAGNLVFTTATGGALTEKMRIDPAGNVGIGTTDPTFGNGVGSKFTVVNNQTAIAAAYSTSQLAFALNALPNGAWTMFDHSASNGAGWTAGITQLSGNVGIGTTTPAAKLDVAGDIRLSGGLCIAGDCKTSWAQVGGQWTASGTNLLYNSGNVGIATQATPTAKLVIGGTAGAEGLDLATSDQYANLRVIRNSRSTFDKDLYLQYGAGAGSKIRFYTDNAESMTLAGGNLGVGTAAPASKLHVAGDITVDGNINAKYQDVAEWVPSTQKLAAGTVVILDPERSNHVLASTASYDTAVAGVVSEKPGLALGEKGEGKALIATTGRVKVKVDATRAPIKIGDLIVTSDVAGVAMKSEPVVVGGRRLHAPGTIIGKALEPLAGGTGEILVLLSLQ